MNLNTKCMRWNFPTECLISCCVEGKKYFSWHNLWTPPTYVYVCLLNYFHLDKRKGWDLVPVHVGVKSSGDSPAMSWLTFNHHGNKRAASVCSSESLQLAGCKKEGDQRLPCQAASQHFWIPQLLCEEIAPKTHRSADVYPPPHLPSSRWSTLQM